MLECCFGVCIKEIHWSQVQQLCQASGSARLQATRECLDCGPEPLELWGEPIDMQKQGACSAATATEYTRQRRCPSQCEGKKEKMVNRIPARAAPMCTWPSSGMCSTTFYFQGGTARARRDARATSAAWRQRAIALAYAKTGKRLASRFPVLGARSRQRLA